MTITEMNGPVVREIPKIRDGCYGEPARRGEGRWRDRDRGQTAIEFLGVTPLIILLMIALWQCALIGYTFSLAGNAADEGAHKGAITEFRRDTACRSAALEDLPRAWRTSARPECTADDSSGLYRAEVKLKVPILVPGILNWHFPVTGTAASPLEG
ncbi:TadE family protein [Streptomyces sp. NPDC058231]|uniref:TadE family protein n=1 Tax=Streptomyces sp. NPDC058231 TaxID=3346392 RepID=UPI0036E5B819